MNRGARRNSRPDVVALSDGPERALRPSSAGDAADVGSDGVERGVGVLAERLDRADANDDDESEHDGVFDGGGAILVLEKANGGLGQRLKHDELRSGPERM